MTDQMMLSDYVVEGLNTVFDDLSKDYGYLAPDVFVKIVTESAQEWAETCFDHVDDDK